MNKKENTLEKEVQDRPSRNQKNKPNKLNNIKQQIEDNTNKYDNAKKQLA